MFRKIIILIFILLVLLVIDFFTGSSDISISSIFQIFTDKANFISTKVILEYRLPRLITALMAGVGLSVSGLLMQTLFRNPLAGPFVLGITSGASLGVALLLLLGLGSGWLASLGVPFAAIAGAFLVLFIILLIAGNVRKSTTLLIVGLMLGYGCGALIGLLQYTSNSEKLKHFVIWGLGNFSDVVWSDLFVLIPVIFTAIIVCVLLSKPLNALLLGEINAQLLGVNQKQSRRLIILLSSILAGVVTAYCGPIAFIGIAVPHIVRTLFKTANHQYLIIGCVLVGAIISVGCDTISQLPCWNFTLPINVITSLIGVPIVIWVLLSQRKLNVH